MATTSFPESLKYGGKLFGLFLLVLLIGGGALGAGAYLAVPELQSYLDTGSVGMTGAAAGAFLAAVGAVTLLVGQFALAYKLIADAVSQGTESEPAVFEPAESEEEESETAPAEQETDTGADAGDGSPAPAGTGAARSEPEESTDTDAETAAEGPLRGPEPAEAGSGSPTDAAADEPGDAEGQTPAEQTAEEIAFGTRDGLRGDEDSAPDEEWEEESSSPPDEKWEEEAASPPDETWEEEAASPPDETWEEEEPAPERSDDDDSEVTETAGNPSSDPLADRFDDE